MCDTLVALPVSTANANVLLGKNSDREPDEAQALTWVEAQTHNGGTVQCTYISIPQASHTYACLLSRPFQMWGAEMGANEHGVVIGNEAVFTKVKIDHRNTGLTGMDLLRLALERCATATEAMKLIVQLLEQYGQDACGGYKNKKFFDHNSFLIADAAEAWILETAGREWIAAPVKHTGSISNRLSLESSERMSANARLNAREKKWWNGQEPFNFSKAYSDWLYTTLGKSRQRQFCTSDLMGKKAGQLAAGDLMQFLQSHHLDDTRFVPSKASTGCICMHATGLLNPSQTTGSMVAEIRTNLPHTLWMTGTSSPCLSVYVPFYSHANLIHELGTPGPVEDDSWWWKAEALHRQWSRPRHYQHVRSTIAAQRRALQGAFIDQEQKLFRDGASAADLRDFSVACVRQVESARTEWGRMALS